MAGPGTEMSATARRRNASGESTRVMLMEVAERLFGSDLSPQEVRFAVVETLAHLEYLRRRGDIATERRGRHVVYRAR